MKAIVALLLLAMSGTSIAQSRAWNFRVFLDDREIGRHQFSRDPQPAAARVVSEATFDVRFLQIPVLRYRHRAVESWRGDCLSGLEAQTETNGEKETVRLSPEDSRWRVETAGGVQVHSQPCLQTFAYWNPAILGWPRLLNAQTGELMQVRATSLGAETVTVRGKPTLATRHRLVGPKLSIDLWYAQDEWVALESLLEGGKRLRYELL